MKRTPRKGTTKTTAILYDLAAERSAREPQEPPRPSAKVLDLNSRLPVLKAIDRQLHSDIDGAQTLKALIAFARYEEAAREGRVNENGGIIPATIPATIG